MVGTIGHYCPGGRVGLPETHIFYFGLFNMPYSLLMWLYICVGCSTGVRCIVGYINNTTSGGLLLDL